MFLTDWRTFFFALFYVWFVCGYKTENIKFVVIIKLIISKSKKNKIIK